MSHDAETLFQACSISKCVTALGVMKLVEQGALDLDISITTYLSADQLDLIATPKTRKLLKAVSLRMLLSHTAGLSVSGFPGYSSNAPQGIEAVLGGVFPANTTQVYAKDIPGRQYDYSGGGYTVVQLIMTTVLKKAFVELMYDLVLAPLKMTRSFYGEILPGEENYAPAYFTGSRKADVPYHIQPELAAAGLWTTPSDLLKVVAAIQSSLESGSYLEKTLAHTMLTEVQSQYGLGWLVRKNGTTFGHSGANNPGYRCILMGFAALGTDGSARTELSEKEKASQGCGICIMTNSACGMTAVSKILDAVLHLRCWLPKDEMQNAFMDDTEPFVDVNGYIDTKWKDWCGKWGEWRLFDDQGPKIQWQNSEMIELLPAAVPSAQYDEGTSVDFVLAGLQSRLRLRWKDGKRSAELWNGTLSSLESVQSSQESETSL